MRLKRIRITCLAKHTHRGENSIRNGVSALILNPRLSNQKDDVKEWYLPRDLSTKLTRIRIAKVVQVTNSSAALYKGAYYTPAVAFHPSINMFVLRISKQFRSSVGLKAENEKTIPQ